MYRILVASILAVPSALNAQDVEAVHTDSVAALVAKGDSLHEALEPAAALAAYERALAGDAAHHGALWRAGRSQVDIAKQIRGDGDSVAQVRDSMYTIARAYAERSIAADSSGANGWFALALALGQLSRTKGGGERIRFARQIYEACARGLARDSTHSGLHHILGGWHAEVRRLSGFSRFIAKTIMGAGFLGRASWDSAAAHLERSVALDPTYVFHRLELAEVYVDMKRYAEARAQLEHIAGLPPTSDVMDLVYKEEAATLHDAIAGRGP